MDVTLFDNEFDTSHPWQQVTQAAGMSLRRHTQWPDTIDIESDCQIVILDQSINPREFLEILRRFMESPRPQVTVVTGANLTADAVIQCMRFGVDYVFQKPFSSDRMFEEFQEIREHAESLCQRRREYHALQTLFAELTIRERDVLDAVLHGKSNRDTADQLNVSIRTIEARRAKLYFKTQSAGVVELVRKVDRLSSLSRIFEAKGREISGLQHRIRDVGSGNLPMRHTGLTAMASPISERT